MIELRGHLLSAEAHGLFVIFAFQELAKSVSGPIEQLIKTYQFVSFVRPINNPLAILVMIFRVLEPGFLLLGVRRIHLVGCPAQMPRRRDTIVDPTTAPDKVHDLCSRKVRHLRRNLNSRGSVSYDRNALVGIIEPMVPLRRVHNLALELTETRDRWPRWVA